MATSAVPAAIDALLGILRAAPGLSGVEVLDGPPVGDQAEADYVIVGWNPEDDQAADVQQDFAGAGARTRDEDFQLHCVVDTWSGDTEVKPRRDRAFALLAAVEDALRATDAAPEAPTLNGTVLWAHLTAGSLQQANTAQGVRARISFTVSCRARI